MWRFECLQARNRGIPSLLFWGRKKTYTLTKLKTASFSKHFSEIGGNVKEFSLAVLLPYWVVL